MAETDRERLDRLEAMLDVARGQISAQGMVIDFLLKAMASVDGASSEAIAMALEVAEMDHVETHGETETAAALHRIREQLGFALRSDDHDPDRS